MVTSTKVADKKVVKMVQNKAVVPQRTLLGEVNEHITCPICRGYYIDATTIVECLHSFCRSCIIKHLQTKSYCPVCEMMINTAKPNIKLDKALQDIVYKLVPGLFQKEMARRQAFYASRPGTAAAATPEQRGEDTERIIFSPEDVISFSLEFSDANTADTDSISSKSSDSNDSQLPANTSRRFLQCPAVVNISHLKKFLGMKFDIDSNQYAVEILYKRVPLPDYYTLMDVAYIYNWKRNEPMRFFYQIIDYDLAIRNRFYDINRNSHFADNKPSPTPEDASDSPVPILNDQASEISSGTDSPMPDQDKVKKPSDTSKVNDKSPQTSKDSKESSAKPSEKSEEVEKSQFLNSFELTAKTNASANTSQVTSTTSAKAPPATSTEQPIPQKVEKTDDTSKRKTTTAPALPVMKKLKIELEKTKLPSINNSNNAVVTSSTTPDTKTGSDTVVKIKKVETISPLSTQSALERKDMKYHQVLPSPYKPESMKRTSSTPEQVPAKRKAPETPSFDNQKTVSPLKLQLPKPNPKPVDTPKPPRKIPDLKPSTPLAQTSNSKSQVVTKLRTDLLANNCDPTIDRSKFLSQVAAPQAMPQSPQSSGDLKALIDSCKINIPSSLSITQIINQKMEPRNTVEPPAVEQKKGMPNKNVAATNNPIINKVPTSPVHNYIQISKLPETDAKKPTNKTDVQEDGKSSANKPEPVTPQPKPGKSETPTSAKGPIPNLKPIAETKLAKQAQASSAAAGSGAGPITFQQTFEQQLQAMQSEKPKSSKPKGQVPNLVPATPKAFSAANKLNASNLSSPNASLTENKSSAALDLSSSPNIQSQLGPQQTKVLETMQSIANFAKQQNLAAKNPISMSQMFSGIPNRSLTSGMGPVRPSVTISQMRSDGVKSNQSPINMKRQETPLKGTMKQMSNLNTINYLANALPGMSSTNPNQNLQRQTRSPSSSPKLVIAEEKQTSSSFEPNQSSQISSSDVSRVTKSESPKAMPGPSKTLLTPIKAPAPAKITGIRPPMTPILNPDFAAANFLNQPQRHLVHQAVMRQMELQQREWIKASKQLDLWKNMAHQSQNDARKDKQ